MQEIGEDTIRVMEIIKFLSGKKFGKTESKSQATKQLRTFSTAFETEVHIGKMIQEHQLLDFGPILKGQDFSDEGWISRGHLYQTIMKTPQFLGENGLKIGDVMELINYYDPSMDGVVDLQFLKNQIDAQIDDPTYHLVLKSKVKDICEEEVVAKISKSKNLGLSFQESVS